MPVIAPFTEEELESMRGYDRKCSEKGDDRMDFIEKCIDDGARIAYSPDAAAKIRAMGMSLRAFAVQCGMGPSTVARQIKVGSVTVKHAQRVLRYTGKPFEYFFQWEKGGSE